MAYQGVSRCSRSLLSEADTQKMQESGGKQRSVSTTALLRPLPPDAVTSIEQPEGAGDPSTLQK
jgi:hypothetical protein